MPLIWGGAISYSPLLYRPRDCWRQISSMLTGQVVQPAAADVETPDFLDHSADKIRGAIDAMQSGLEAACLDALIVLFEDDGRAFDSANLPPFHVHAGRSIWGDTSIPELRESANIRHLDCDSDTADLLLEELFHAGFDMAEGRGEFTPVGDTRLGASRALCEPVSRLGFAGPVIPVHISCGAAFSPGGERIRQFGAALGAAINLSAKRIGILASGGLSGEPKGYMAGWIDDILDNWVLRQLERGGPSRIAPMFDVESNALRGSSAQIRLWLAVASAAKACGGKGKTIAYLPLHAAATGLGFFRWEIGKCP